MKRFHFMNNVDLDKRVSAICQLYKVRDLSELFTLLFEDEDEFLRFVKAFCIRDRVFFSVKECDVDSYVKIPEAVFKTLKLCHMELNTFSIAFIFRSILISVVDCFQKGGMVLWNEYKRDLISAKDESDNSDIQDNFELIEMIKKYHMAAFPKNFFGKISLFSYWNSFLCDLKLSED